MRLVETQLVTQEAPTSAATELIEALAAENEQLRQALASRVVIEQARGVLVERFRLLPDEAFTLLRSAARADRVRLHDLAAQVVASRQTPRAIQRRIRGGHSHESNGGRNVLDAARALDR